jgi:hypothetical protein
MDLVVVGNKLVVVGNKLVVVEVVVHNLGNILEGL